MAGWLKKKRMGGNVQNLWEDKTPYGKGLHKKLFNEEVEDDENEDEEEVKECGLDRISQITSPEFGGKMVDVDDDDDEYEGEVDEYEGGEEDEDEGEDGKEVVITVKSEEDEESEDEGGEESEEEGESEEGEESEEKEGEEESEKSENEDEIDEAATGLDAQSKDPVEKLASMISSFRDKSGESVSDKDALRQAAKTLLFGDLKKLNMKI